MKKIILIASLVMCLFLVSGCIDSYDYEEETSELESSETTRPFTETIIVYGGEITTDTFGNEYGVDAFGFEGIDLSVNSHNGFIRRDCNCNEWWEDCKGCHGAIVYYESGLTYADIPYARIYLKAFDETARKATIEIQHVSYDEDIWPDRNLAYDRVSYDTDMENATFQEKIQCIKDHIMEQGYTDDISCSAVPRHPVCTDERYQVEIDAEIKCWNTKYSN
jgi:hypothetical protein